MIRILSKLLIWLAVIFVSISIGSCENDNEQEPGYECKVRALYEYMEIKIKTTRNCYEIGLDYDPFPNTPERFYSDFNCRKLCGDGRGFLNDVWYNDQTGDSCVSAIYEIKPYEWVFYNTGECKYIYKAKNINNGVEFKLNLEDYGETLYVVSSDINQAKAVFAGGSKVGAVYRLIREIYVDSICWYDERYWLKNHGSKYDRVADAYNISDMHTGMTVYLLDSLGYPNKAKFEISGDWMTVSTFHYKNRRLFPCGKLYFTIKGIHYGKVLLTQYTQIDGEKIRDAILRFEFSGEKSITKIYKFY